MTKKIDIIQWDPDPVVYISKAHLEQPVPPALHIVVRPDGRQLFLIASYPEQQLARRFRRRAIVASAGFAAATYALAWLLQGVFGSA